MYLLSSYQCLMLLSIYSNVYKVYCRRTFITMKLLLWTMALRTEVESVAMN